MTDAGPSAQRKLTTVLSADVHGYSRLMGADEEGTFVLLKAYREVADRLIAAYGGRVVNTWGDGLLAEFPSVVEAVRAAIDIQAELSGRNAILPEDRRMVFRIGINLGDVIVDGDDLYGDGVNIAARLQAAADPGGILISRTVHDQVRSKLSVHFEFLGDLDVKNIDEGVPSFAIRVGGPEKAAQASPPPPRPAAPQKMGAAARPVSRFRISRLNGTLALAAAAVVAVNMTASPTVFWSRWPLLVFAVIASLDWARRAAPKWRRYAFYVIAATTLVMINLMAGGDTFWAVWPLLAIAVAAGLHWLRRNAVP